jgi:thiol:disulfide interchange protein DsbC
MKSIKAGFNICAALFAGAVLAQSNPTMLAKVREAYPSTQIQDVLDTPIQGIFEVRMGTNVAFTDTSARYLIFGAMFDAVKREVLTMTQPAQDGANLTTPIGFPHEHLTNALRTVKGNGSRVFAVFSDPKCGYCRMLEKELAKLNNVTIYTFIYASLGESSMKTGVDIWCSDNKLASWAQAVNTGKTKTTKSCENPIEKNLRLGASLRVAGTPTLIAQNGSMVAGYRTAAQIDTWLTEQRSTSPSLEQ